MTKKAKRFESSITVNKEYLPATLYVTNPEITLKTSVGPRWKFHLFPFPGRDQ